MPLKISQWYNLECDYNLYHFDLIENIYNDLVKFINKNELSFIGNEKEFIEKLIKFLYKNSTHTRYKYF